MYTISHADVGTEALFWLQAGNPSASSATVSVVQAGTPDAKSIKAAKAAKKAQDFNQNFGNDVVV